jgi:hypothetical protein
MRNAMAHLVSFEVAGSSPSHHFLFRILGSPIGRPIIPKGESRHKPRKHVSPHGRLVIFSLTIDHHITSLVIDPFLLSCRQVAQVTAVDAEAVWPVETVEAVCAARATQVMVTVAAVVVVAVAVGVATRPISTGTQPPEEHAIFIGPLGPAIAGSTARTNTRQGFRRPHPSHSPRIILPTFSRSKGWPRTMVLL